MIRHVIENIIHGEPVGEQVDNLLADSAAELHHTARGKGK